MGKFRKGQPRPAGAGRKKGTPNRLTASVKQVFEATFRELQSDPRRSLLAWATRNRTNLTEFYRIAARFIPIEATVPPHLGDEEGGNMFDEARRMAFLIHLGKREEESRRARERLALPAPVERVVNPAGEGGN